MKRKIKNLILALTYFATILFLLALTANFPVRNRLDQEAEGRLVFPALEEPISLTVTPKHPNFNIVELIFKNPNLVSRDQLVVLVNREDKVNVAQQAISGLNIGDPTHIRIQFPPQEDSQNQTFEINIKPEKVSKNPIYLGAIQERQDPIKPYTKLFYRTKLKPASLAWSTLVAVIKRAGSDPVFFLSLFFLIEALAFLI